MERSRERAEAPVYAKKGRDKWTNTEGGVYKGVRKRGGKRDRERERCMGWALEALGAPSSRKAGLLANNQNGWLIQMESGYT